VTMVQDFEMFCFAPLHPDPLPQGERGGPDESYLKGFAAVFFSRILR
jgi:hypothetical protein